MKKLKLKKAVKICLLILILVIGGLWLKNVYNQASALNDDKEETEINETVPSNPSSSSPSSTSKEEVSQKISEIQKEVEKDFSESKKDYEEKSKKMEEKKENHLKEFEEIQSKMDDDSFFKEFEKLNSSISSNGKEIDETFENFSNQNNLKEATE